jgi:hypothetical protein
MEEAGGAYDDPCPLYICVWLCPVYRLTAWELKLPSLMRRFVSVGANVLVYSLVNVLFCVCVVVFSAGWRHRSTETPVFFFFRASRFVLV